MLGDLEELDLEAADVDDRACAVFSAMPRLRTLNLLGGCGVGVGAKTYVVRM